MTTSQWLIIGFVGQALFGARFIIQWIVSEKKGESTIPLAFWYCSIGGAVVLLSYAIYKEDPVFIVGQSLGSIVYVRNLILIDRKRKSMVGAENEQLEN
ncbi:MAG: lipid-A-disaccharide synthase N-terminal domain-containing protein [Nitrospinae bacterium]|nr:lipid-A-disaccharide synthase N-terminal domain-containing protein [Nitrospinota bacterium]MBL7019102.1 lipid-A-disaccharide synthase N-terminal domain-containing protein [Nitrospinaceae bacterium]